MRRRMTWTDNGEVARHRRASEHPATPHEGPASPAHKEDPAADAYQSKEATPVHKAAALERKAAKCIRIATAMLGDGASVAAIEDQALVLMDLTDRAIKASLSRIGEDEEAMDADEAIDMDEATVAEEDLAEEPKKKSAMERRLARLERKLRRLQAASEDPGDHDTDESAMEEEEAASADPGDHDTDESAAKKADWIPGKVTPDGWEPGHEEAMLAEMLEEEGMMPAMSDEEAMLAEMLEEEGMWGSKKDEYKRTDGHKDGDVDGHYKDYEEAASADPGDHDTDESAMDHDEESMEVEVVADPMGLMDAEMEEDEMMVLAKLFGEKTADDDDDDDDDDDEDKEEKEDHDEGAIKDDEDHIEDLEEDKDEEEEDLKEEEEASKKSARLRPQPKKASTGAKRLGSVNKEAASEISDLSQLWESAPDVSKFF